MQLQCINISYFILILMNLFAVSFIYCYYFYNDSAKNTLVCISLSTSVKVSLGYKRNLYLLVRIIGILGGRYSYNFLHHTKLFYQDFYFNCVAYIVHSRKWTSLLY